MNNKLSMFDFIGPGLIEPEIPLWKELPTLEDYIDLDDIYDEEVEKLFYEATKKQGW